MREASTRTFKSSGINTTIQEDSESLSSSSSTCSSLFFEAYVSTRPGIQLNHSCYFCNCVHTDEHNLEQHMTIHTTESPVVYICKFCKKRYRNETTFNNHLKAKHEHKRSIRCYLCSASLETVQELKSHLMWHNTEQPFLCTECPEVFELRRRFRDHLKLNHPQIKPPFYSCTFCPKIQTTPAYWRMHTRNHSDSNRFWCYFCGRVYELFETLQKHMSRHTSEICSKVRHKRFAIFKTKKVFNFPCYFCKSVFLNYEARKRHISSHTMEKPYKCKRCRKPFRWYSAYVQHRHRLVNCEMCPLSFCDMPGLRRHKNFRHSKTKTTIRGQYKFCGKNYFSAATLQLHMKIHGRQSL